MKKMFKKIIVLICALALFTYPAASAYAATSVPVLVASYPETGFKLYEFQPDPLTLLPGQGAHLTDGANDWYVPAGKTFIFGINTLNVGSVMRVQVYESGYGWVYDAIHYDTVDITLPGDYTGRYFHVLVTAIQPSTITNFAFFHN